MIYKGHNGEYIELSELKKGSFLNFDNDLSYPILSSVVRLGKRKK
jgi:hypothetical protein